MTFGEDRSSVWAGHAPQVMVALRSAVIGRPRLLGATNVAAATRCFAAQPVRALAAVGLPLENA